MRTIEEQMVADKSGDKRSPRVEMIAALHQKKHRFDLLPEMSLLWLILFSPTARENVAWKQQLDVDQHSASGPFKLKELKALPSQQPLAISVSAAASKTCIRPNVVKNPSD